MEVYHVSGRADDPAYAQAEMLADKLEKILPGISIVKHPKLPDDWASYLVDTCRTKGFLAYYRSPLVWTSAERLVGDEKEFAALVKERYGIELDARETDKDMLAAIAKENLETCQQELQLLSAPKSKLYISPLDIDSFGPWTLLMLSNTLHEIIVVDLSDSAAPNTIKFLELNPRRTFPFLQDKSGFCLSESHAIMRYIIDKNELDDRFYPSDPEARGVVDAALAYRLETLGPGIRIIISPFLHPTTAPAENISPAEDGEKEEPKQLSEEEIEAETRKKIEAEKLEQKKYDRVAADLQYFAENFLSKTLFSGGDEPTISDYSIAPILRALPLTPLKTPAAIQEYLQRFDEVAPAFSLIFNRQFGPLFENSDK